MKKVSDLFEPIYGINLELIYCNITSSNLGIPFVSRTSRNNGVVAYVEQMDEYTPNPPHTISVAGSGSVLSCFYQEKPYYSGRDLFYLKPKIDLTANQMLYYCFIINSNSYKYSYGRQANRTLPDILIPSLEDIPTDFLNLRIPSPSPKRIIEKNFDLRKIIWQWFSLDDLFTLKKCKCNSAIDLLNNGDEIFYIGAKKSENGVMQRVMRDENLVSEGNCIVFIGDGQGSVGYTTYQPEDFIGSSTLTCGYNLHLNKYNALFIVTVLDMERFRYSFGRKYGKEVVKRIKIKLPAKNENPDFDFMENYIKSLPYSSSI
jgi:hypothetical protein